ncbi:hypothetical protein Aduo_016484 [Ancylostoma duodenale]
MCSASLQFKPGAKHVIHPRRPVPYPAQPAVDKQLDRHESTGVISKVNYSDWSSTQHQSFSSRSRTDHYAYAQTSPQALTTHWISTNSQFLLERTCLQR